MLVLARKPQEQILILTSDGPIVIKAIDIRQGQCRIGIDAPKCCNVARWELLTETKGDEQ